MNGENTGKKAFHIGRYLVLWFAVIMVFIYVCSGVLDLFIQGTVWPLFDSAFKLKEISMAGTGIADMLKYILIFLVSITIARLPALRLLPVTSTLASVLGVQTVVPEEIQAQGQLAVTGYSIALVLCLSGVLLVSLLPYVAGGIWYTAIVKKKIREMISFDRARTKEYDRQRNLMLSDMAHDIKTPITAMSGYAKALNDGLVPPEKQQEYLNSIYNKSMRVSELINMMFEYIKLDSAGYELHRAKGDLAELCRQVAAELYQDFEEAGLELEVDIPEEQCEYCMDSLQFARVVTNLCTNAIKYAGTGSRVLLQLKIKDSRSAASAGNEDRRYEIRVADTGEQIEDGLAECIFTPFTRGDKTRSTKGGTGLGLSIAHKIIELHDGELILDRDPGDGYTKAFVIEI